MMISTDESDSIFRNEHLWSSLLLVVEVLHVIVHANGSEAVGRDLMWNSTAQRMLLSGPVEFLTESHKTHYRCLRDFHEPVYIIWKKYETQSKYWTVLVDYSIIFSAKNDSLNVCKKCNPRGRPIFLFMIRLRAKDWLSTMLNWQRLERI